MSICTHSDSSTSKQQEVTAMRLTLSPLHAGCTVLSTPDVRENYAQLPSALYNKKCTQEVAIKSYQQFSKFIKDSRTQSKSPSGNVVTQLAFFFLQPWWLLQRSNCCLLSTKQIVKMSYENKIKYLCTRGIVMIMTTFTKYIFLINNYKWIEWISS